MKDKKIVNIVALLYVGFSLFMFLIEKRMNNNIQKYSINCLVLEKDKVGTRTKRTYLQINNQTKSFDSDQLYNRVKKGDTITILYFRPFDIIMLPKSSNYFEMFVFSLFVALLIKALIYIKNL